MKIITVSAAHSGAGKTRVVEGLLKLLKGWSALKVTVLHNGLCPTGKDCGACRDLGSKFSIVSDKKTIEESGKDTQRFKKAGAQEVLWLKARPSGLSQGLKQAITTFKTTNGLIIEGTSVLKYLNPDLAIFVSRPLPCKNKLYEKPNKAQKVSNLYVRGSKIAPSCLRRSFGSPCSRRVVPSLGHEQSQRITARLPAAEVQFNNGRLLLRPRTIGLLSGQAALFKPSARRHFKKIDIVFQL